MPEMPIEVYFGGDDTGHRVCVQGMGGGRLTVWNPVSLAYEIREIQFGGQPATLQSIFNNTAYVDGVANQSLVDGKIYYATMFLTVADPTTPKFNFLATLQNTPSTRYGFTLNGGHPYITDSHGNICTVLGMVYPVSGSISNMPSGPNAKLLTSNSPWSAPSQPLPINSTQIGLQITNSSPQDVGGGFGIYACQWAWRGCKSYIAGYIGDNSIGSASTLWMRPFAKSMATGTKHYGPTTIVQFSRPGLIIPYGGHGVSLALDEGVYLYGLEAWISGQAVYLNLEHVVDVWA